MRKTILAAILFAVAVASLAWQQPRQTPAVASPLQSYLYLPLAMVDDGECTFLEEGGVLIMEIETAELTDPSWAFETDIAGYLGDGYYTWRGPDLFGTPGVGVLSYPFFLQNGGDYLLRIRNHHNHPANDQQNDVWVKMDGGDWVKLFSSESYVWTWRSAFDFHNHQTDARYDGLPAGEHVLYLSARSHGFRMDRIALYQPGTNGEDLSLPQSPCQ